MQITVTEAGFQLDQKHYTKSLRVLPSECTFKDFTSSRHKQAWLAHTRSEICCAVNMVAQFTESSVNDYTKAINRVVKHVQKDPSKPLEYEKLFRESLRIKVHSDPSLLITKITTIKSNTLFFSQKKTDRYLILHYSSHKCRRIKIRKRHEKS